jgi:dienelactone hydrolase
MSSFKVSRRDALQQMATAAAATGFLSSTSFADAPRVVPVGQVPGDRRLGALKDLNGYFPFVPSESPEAWANRREYVRRQLLLACGLLPMPSRPAIDATVHGRIERDDYTVDRVYFESSPGLFVTGSLYQPLASADNEPRPTILSPHGHWNTGRFYDAGETGIKREIASGAEEFEVGGRYPLQARAVQLARMGCNVFLYDMQGYADGGSLTYELAHRFAKQRPELSSPERWGLFSAQSELRLWNVLGLQTWNSIRTVDWLCSRPDVDQERIGVTGASGGGTQTFMLAALDERIAAAFPAVMVSTAMQGGCTCENATYLRVDTGNIEIAAMIAPRPVFMSGANDWTVEIEKKGLPELKQHFAMLGAPDNVDAKWFDFPHNYNRHSRAMMYEFFNRHFKLGFDTIVERDFKPLTVADATVFDETHPAPAKTDDTEVALLRALEEDIQKQLAALTPRDEKSLAEYRREVGGAFEVMIGRDLPAAGTITYEKLTETERDGFIEYTSWLRNPEHEEEIPTVFLYPTSWNGEVVLWIDGAGKSGVFNSDGTPITAVAKLVKAGFAIAAIDVFLTGEFLKKGQSLTQARTVNNPREFLGYTLGYNNPLFSQRVHDIQSLLSYAKYHNEGPKKLHLAGVNGGGILAATACAMNRDSVSSLAVDTAGFRFGTITDIRDVNLLPGAVRYGDVPAVLALCAPARLLVAGEHSKLPDLTLAAYAACNSSVTAFSGDEATVTDGLSDWFIAHR